MKRSSRRNDRVPCWVEVAPSAKHRPPAAHATMPAKRRGEGDCNTVFEEPDRKKLRPSQSRITMPARSQDNAIKVSGRSNVKSIAGGIAHAVRTGSSPLVLATGATSVNQATKAVAIARKYLAGDGVDVCLQPELREGNHAASLSLHLRSCKPRDRFEAEVDLAVSSCSVPNVVAGAIAARVREQTSVCLTGIGVDAVSNALLSLCKARHYLEDDGLDIKCFPQFIHVMKDGAQFSAVRLNTLIEQI